MASAVTSKKIRKKKQQELTPEQHFQKSLAAFSRSNDLAGALELYRTSPPPRGLSANHFNILLHLCASSPDSSVAPSAAAAAILDHMLASGFPPSEATLASAARVAAAGEGGGDRAFCLVKETAGRYGLELKLRTCAPALLACCGAPADAEKAYEVESYMVEKGVELEEAEIRALLRVSAEAGKGEKVYGYLHRLRGRGGPVELETAEVIERWFGSEAAAEVEGRGEWDMERVLEQEHWFGSEAAAEVEGRGEWDMERVLEQVMRNGGGWHGEGWLGKKGRWKVGWVKVGGDSRCGGCGELLKGVDIGAEEAERFAEAIASLATERGATSNFKDFQEWLLGIDSAFEAVVDGANIGLYQQNFADGGFSLSQLEAAVKEMRDKCQGKWPLVILHNNRLQSMNSSAKKTLDDWLNHGVLYATPKGSNDDWYWLYAAVKLKCLLMTNDEMRDHIFELLGNKFVPAWKERHQVRYAFLKGSLKLEMPPAYSVVIQESESGAWHVPLKDCCEDERSRPWLCITRCLPHRECNGIKQITGTSNGFANFDGIPAENEIGLERFSPFHASDLAPTLGKRKDRSP